MRVFVAYLPGFKTVQPIDLSVIIPAYQEAENLALLLPELQSVLQQLSTHYEIIIVDTVTPLDNTRAICTAAQVNYIQRAPSNDFGDAIRSGIRASQGQFVIFMDGDGSHDPHFIAELYQYREDFDVVIASRYVSGGKTENPKILIFMSWVLNFIYSLVLGIKVKDISNSFKLYNGELLRSLKLSATNFDIIQEILFKLYRKKPKLRVKEIPFTFQQRKHGETKRRLFAFMLTYVFSVVKMKFSSLFSHHP